MKLQSFWWPASSPDLDPLGTFFGVLSKKGGTSYRISILPFFWVQILGWGSGRIHRTSLSIQIPSVFTNYSPRIVCIE